MMGQAVADAPDDIVPAWTELDDPRAVEFVHLALKGWTLAQIAAELDVAPNTLWRLRQKYRLDDLVDALTKEAARQTAQAYITLRHRAMTTAQDLLEHPDATIREKALRTVLKYLGDRGDVPEPPREEKRRGPVPHDAELASGLRAAISGRRRGD